MSPTDDLDIMRKRPSKGKAVRFADHEGLRLCEVFHIHCHDEDLKGNKTAELQTVAKTKPKPLKIINLPWTLDALNQRLKATNVTLENVVKTEKGIIGIAAVRNIAYQKTVIVRYSFNGWTTVNETAATFYKQDSSHHIDYFVFVVRSKTACFEKRWNVDFALCYKVNGEVYWDNNNGENYCISSS